MLSLPYGLQLSLRLHHCRFCLRPVLKILPAFCPREKKRLYSSNENYGKTDPDSELQLLKRLNRPVLSSDFPSDQEEYMKEHSKWKRNQERHSFRPNVDPADTSIVLFPGQGSQLIGMGEKLLVYHGVKELYDTASEILRYDLLNLCVNGPKKELDKTVHCQPAVFVTSIAALEKLKEEKPTALEHCIGTAGFSVGEYAAFVFAGMMNFEDALSVVKVRAEAMQKASEMIPSGMMTVLGHHNSKLGLAMEAAKEFCRTRLDIADPVCNVANYLFTNCKVIAGHQEALDFIRDNASDFGLKNRLKTLPVSGAFHTTLMKSAEVPVIKALKKIELHNPRIRVHSNLDGKRYRNRNLVYNIASQISSAVKWEQTMHILYTRPSGTGFPNTYEVGPGNALGKILKRVNEKGYANYNDIEV